MNDVTEKVIGAAIAVHRELGPGLLEAAYDACLASELEARGISFEKQKPLPLIYRNVRVDCGFRLDFLIERRLVVEVKSVERIDPVFVAQVLTYLKLTGCQLGLLINFNVPLLKDGIRRIALGYTGLPPRSSATPR